jgi:hypothetical protein
VDKEDATAILPAEQLTGVAQKEETWSLPKEELEIIPWEQCWSLSN